MTGRTREIGIAFISQSLVHILRQHDLVNAVTSYIRSFKSVRNVFLVASLYCFVALLSCCVKIPPSAGQGDSQTTRRTPANNEAAQQAQQSTTEELIRELESIFGRLEEGNFREGVELARSYHNEAGTHEL